MAVLIRNPHRLPLLAVTFGQRRCDRCGRRVRLLLLPCYRYRGGARWCLPCVREVWR